MEKSGSLVSGFLPYDPKEWEMNPEMREKAAEKADKAPIVRGVLAYFPRAIKEIANVSAYGAKKHNYDMNEKGFLDPVYTDEMYLDAIGRHLVEREIEGERNPKDGDLLHRAQLAWNALASLEKYLIQVEKEKENGI